jgi:hypothetical protein
MQRQAVESSTINSVGYDRAAKVVEIEFTGGAIFRYAPVPVYVYRELLDAPSKGVYVNTVIKPRYKSEGPLKT